MEENRPDDDSKNQLPLWAPLDDASPPTNNEDGASVSLILPLDAFVRSFAVQRMKGSTFFLGAGASVTSGVHSADQCLWEWKRDIFLSNNQGLEKQFSDVSLPIVRRRIQQWLDAEGRFPREGDPGEYAFFAEACYPIAEDRRQYFASMVQGKMPHTGYQLLALLAEARVAESIWSTNFDGLAAKAITSGSKITAIEIGLDSTQRILRTPTQDEVWCVSMHGDFRYDALRNTARELQIQEDQLQAALVSQTEKRTLVVVGYSGRDDTIMETFQKMNSTKGSGRLYWCGFGEEDVPPRVAELLELARRNGREAFYVPTEGFDDLLVRLSLSCLDQERRERALEMASRITSEPIQSAFSIESSAINGLIKSNAFAVEVPSEVLQFDADLGDGPGVWKRVREWASTADVVAVPFRRKVLAVGLIDDVKKAFGSRLRSEIERTPVAPHELGRQHGAITALLTEALVRAFAVVRGLATDGRGLLWTNHPIDKRIINGVTYHIHDAAVLFLRRYAGKQYLIIKPTLRAQTVQGDAAPVEIERELKRQILGKQWNKAFSGAVQAWRARLLPDDVNRLEFPPNSGSTFRFTVASVSEYTKLSIPGSKWPISIPKGIAPYSNYHGIQYEEPPLVFARRTGEGFVKDTHPVRGVVQNRPYDYALTERGLADNVKVGVVCPSDRAGELAAYLARLHQPIRPDTKQEYLLQFPGFAQAFGLPLSVAGSESGGWMNPKEPAPETGIREGAAALASELVRCVDSVHASYGPSVILIHVPERWTKWEEYELDGEYFNLHHFVKAYAVQKGIATAFLRERTLSKAHQGEILWWLAVSLYAKAMRTPWVVENLGDDLAFMGLGFSLDRGRPLGQHVVVGCSHIYSSDGRGLRYRLSKLDQCVVRQGNPFMSRDDSRRMGEHARQLFFESGALPGRLVIHKRTPFSADEIAGLREGLKGIDQIDMLEITEESALRFTATRFYRDSGVQDDAFPVRRGTAVVLDGRHALLWVHGSAEAIQQGKRYYLGKSRIPAPLLVTRHAGHSSLSTLAREILGLSKMNWNNPDLYSKLPATIDSSNTIARIGSLLERFGPFSYDYRLFI